MQCGGDAAWRGGAGGEEGDGDVEKPAVAVSYKQWVKNPSVFPKWEHLPLMSLKVLIFFFSFALSSHFKESGE